MDTRKGRKRLIAVILLLLLLGLGTMGAAWFFRSDPLERVRELRQKLAAKDLSAEERKEVGKELRAAMSSLTPEQRKELGAQRRQKMEEKLRRFHKLSRAEQIAELDKDIDRMQGARQRRQDKAQRDGKGNASGTSGTSQSMTQQTGADGGRGWGRKSPIDRETFRQTMLDNSSPEFRGLMAEYRQMFGNRMQQRGLTSMPWGR